MSRSVRSRPPCRFLDLTIVAASVAMLAGLADRAEAELIVGLTTQNTLISFDSDTPGTVTTIGAITGVTAGDTLVGIDRRPQGIAGTAQAGPNNGRIYAVGVNLTNGSARIYALNESNGAASLISTLIADPADTTDPFPFTTVSGTSFGVDFNPTVDRLRVTSNTGQNLRLNVDNGLTNLDGPLAYASGDPNFGDAPVDVAVAYSNNFGNATSTVLRGVDIGQTPDLLVIHSNPNGGLLTTSLSLPFDSTTDIGYDISGLSGTPYFSATSGSVTSFYAGTTLVGVVGGGVALRGFAAPVGAVIPEPASLALVVVGAGGVLAAMRRRRSRAAG